MHPTVTVLIEVTDENDAWVDITPDVRLTSATFMSQANGVPGTCSFSIKDPALNPQVSSTFPDIGARIRLKIDGSVEWYGFVMTRIYEYAFPVEDTTDYRKRTRFLVINGQDLNILFSRRYVFDQVDPTMEIPLYPQGTNDQTIITSILADYVDLSGYGLDLASGLTNVGTPALHEEFKAAAIGWSLGQVFTNVSQNLGAIFYIDPDKVLRWVDDETVSAPATLSDQPGVSEVGYRELRVNHSASEMCNDMTVRGAGVGSPKMVVSRNEDATSIARHGRWQFAELHNDMYKQTTADLRSSSYVDGSPQNRRGHKNPRDTVGCTIYEAGFHVGMVTTVESLAHGWSRAVPIRQVTITFPTHEHARFDLVLSFEIDIGLMYADWPGPPGKKPLPWGEDITCVGGGGGGGGGGTPQTLYGFLIPPHRHERDEILWEIAGRYVYNEYDQSDWWPAYWYDWTNEWYDPETYGEAPTQIFECPLSHDAGWPAVDITFPMTGIFATDSDGDDVPDELDTSTDCSYDTFFRSVDRTGGELVANPWLGVDEAQYVSDDSGNWGIIDSGGSWSQSGVAADLMQGIYGGNAVMRAQIPTTPEAWVFGPNLEGLAPYTSADYMIQWRFRGDVWVEYTLGDPVPTPTFWAMGHLIKEVPVTNLAVVAGSIAGVPTDIRTGDPSNDWRYTRIRISNDGTDTLWQCRSWLAGSAEPSTWDDENDYYTGLEGPSMVVSFASSGWQTTTVSGGGTPIVASPEPDDPHYGQFEIASFALVDGDCGGGGGACTFTTTFPYVAGSLKASQDGVNLPSLTETGDGRTFTISGVTGTIEITYLRSDAYIGDDEGTYTDPGGPGTYDGGGSGEWQWPCEGYITQEYGCTGFSWEPPRGTCAHFHDGIDIANVSGTPLYAPAAGTINFVGWNPYDIGNDPAYIVVLDIPGGYQVGMAHLLPIAKVYAGQSIDKGQLIGYMGNTGKSTGSHLHFEARYGGNDFDPRVKLEGNP